MKIVLGTVSDGKLCSRDLVPELKVESVSTIIAEATRQADLLFSPGMWHIHKSSSLLFGGYIVSDNPANSGDTITIQ